MARILRIFQCINEAAEGIGYLPQEASIFRSMTVEDNIRAMLQTTSKKSDEIEAIVESLIEEFHIGHVRDRMGCNYLVVNVVV